MQYAHARSAACSAQAGDALRRRSRAGARRPARRSTSRTRWRCCARLADYPELLEAAARELAPHQLAFYLRELAPEFHSYYNAQRSSSTTRRCARAARAVRGGAPGARATAWRSSASARRRRCAAWPSDQTEKNSPRRARVGRRVHARRMFVGLIAGLAMSLAIAFYLNKTPVPFLTAKAKRVREGRRRGQSAGDAGLPQGAVAAGRPRSPGSTSTRSCPGRKSPFLRGSCATG